MTDSAKYYATVEKIDGKLETVNGIMQYKVDGPFLYLAGVDFEMFLSSTAYAFIEIQEGSL